jgi:Fe-S cluster assembly scaffold protein SufB
MADRTVAGAEDARRRAEEARHRPAPYGPDVDPALFAEPPERARLSSMAALAKEIEGAALEVGVEPSERSRAGSFFQVDRSPIYARIRERHRGKLELLPLSEALSSSDRLHDCFWRSLDAGLDRYTAAAELERTGGFFLRVLAGERIGEPVQACLLVQENNVSQNVHNVVVVEEGAELQMITGCTIHPWVDSGLHVGVTEIFLGEGATLSDTRVHNWSKGFHVRPRTGVVVRRNATYFSNYILLRAVRSEQASMRMSLEGENARAQIQSVVVGREDSIVDLGVSIDLLGRGTRAESISRALAQDRSQIYLRGTLVGKDDGSRGHLDCRGMLLSKRARIETVPELVAESAPGCQLSHEAAIGPVAEDAVEYLMTRGLTRDDAVSVLTRGFINLKLPGLPEVLAEHLRKVIAATAVESM